MGAGSWWGKSQPRLGITETWFSPDRRTTSKDLYALVRTNTTKVKIDDQCDMLAVGSEFMVEKGQLLDLRLSHGGSGLMEPGLSCLSRLSHGRHNGGHRRHTRVPSGRAGSFPQHRDGSHPKSHIQVSLLSKSQSQFLLVFSYPPPRL